MAKLKGPTVPTLQRSSGFIDPKVEIVIACEGKNTEPKYFQDCVNGYGAGLVRLRVLPVTGVPLTVVRGAIEEREALLEKHKRSKEYNNIPFRVWAVFDRDEHPNIDEAFELAKSNKIDIAFSDPCFEIWPLLHIEPYGSQDERHLLQARLSQVMKNYDHEKGAIIDFQMIRDDFQVAYERAKIHLLERVREGNPYGRPSTTVGELVRKIIENGKFGERRRLV